MRKITRRGIALGMLAGLVAVPASIPALAQDGAPAEISHRQSVLTELSSTGEAGTSRVFTQLNVAGEGPVEVVLERQSTRGLRNLGGIGRPSTDGDSVVWGIDATPDGVNKRTVATNTADLPVDIEIAYEFEGEAIEDPSDIVGRTGELTVTYKVRNNTAREEEIDIFNARQEPTTEMVDVGVPIVGSLSLPLDERFTNVRADDANVAGDGRGNTVVNWSMVLFEPLGSFEQEVSWTAQVSDAIVPEANAQLMPVSSESFPSLPNAQSAYADTFAGLQQITDGAVRIDMTMIAIADGSGQLLDGMNQIADGSGELADGLVQAADGSGELAAGTGEASAGSRELASGLGELRDGAGQLSGGLGEIDAGANALSGGLGEIDAGTRQLSGGLGEIDTGARQLSGGLGEIDAGTRQLSGGLGEIDAGAEALADGLGAAAPGAAEIRDGLRALLAGVGSPEQGGTVIGGLTELRAGLADIGTPLGDALAGALVSSELRTELIAGLQAQLAPVLGEDQAAVFAPLIVNGLTQAMAEDFAPQFGAGFAASPEWQQGVLGGVDLLLAGMNRPDCDRSSPETCGVKQVLELLAAGQAELADGLKEAADGSRELAAGTGEAAAGSRELAAGTGQAAAGSRELAAGTGQAAAGSRELAAGTGQAAAGSRELAAGAGAAADGGVALSDGLGQIDDGANQLASGLGDARDGSGQLAEGAGDLAEGGEGLDDALNELQEFGTNKILNDVSRAGLQPDRLLKQAQAADERAKAGDGLPYGTVEGADASAVYQFEIAGVGADEGVSTPVRAGAALLAFGAVGALGMGVRRRLI